MLWFDIAEALYLDPDFRGYGFDESEFEDRLAAEETMYEADREF